MIPKLYTPSKKTKPRGVPCRLFGPQWDFLAASHQGHQELVFLAARSVGKSVVSGHFVRERILTTPGRGAIIAPTLSQAQEVLNYLIPLLDEMGVEHRWGRKPPQDWCSDVVEYRNVLSVYHPSFGCKTIYVCSCENKSYENIRGKSLSWFLMDEAALVPENVLPEVLEPALRGQGGDFAYLKAYLTSPRGSANWVSRIALEPGIHTAVIHAPMASNHIEWPAHRIEELRQRLPPRVFKQECLGEIVDVGDASQIHVKPLIQDRPMPESPTVWVSSDQNVSPLTAVLAWRHEGHTHAWDEILIEDSATASELAREIRRKLPKGTKRLALTGDASGNARNVIEHRSFYQKLIELLRDAGIKTRDRTLRKNPGVFNSREQLNEMFTSGTLSVAPRCKNLQRDMLKARYTPDLTTDKRFFDPHLLDALAYLCWAQTENTTGRPLALE